VDPILRRFSGSDKLMPCGSKRGLRISILLRCPVLVVRDGADNDAESSLRLFWSLAYGSSRTYLARSVMAEAAVHIVDGGIARSDVSGQRDPGS
jgi:hypothetical protein